MRRFARRLLWGCAVMCATAAAVLAALFATPGTALAQAGPERIVSYDAVIAIQRDGSSLVTEQIVYDFGGQQRHGIFRQIPARSRYNSSYDRIYPIDVLSVRSPDAPAQYTASNSGSAVTIRIGDPNRTITGQHTYRITYLIRGSLNGFADHDELYWNAIGGQWNVPIDQATVRVIAPGTVTRAACFAGPLGSKTPCEGADIVKRDASFSQTRLSPHEGLTVVVAFPKGLVAPPRPVLVARWSLQRAFAFTPVSAGTAGGLLAVLAILGAMILVRRRGRRYSRSAAQLAGTTPVPDQLAGTTPVQDRVVGTTPVQDGEVAPLPGRDLPALESEPPAALRPAQASALLDGTVKARDITSTIVDLAVRGYLRIEDPPWQADQARPDWQLTRRDRNDGYLLPYEQMILDGLFAGAEADSDPDAASTRLSNLGSKSATALKHARVALYSSVTSLGWFTARPDRVRRRWLAWGFFVFAIGVIAVIAMAASTQLALAPTPVVLAGLAMMGCARWMPERTAEGNEMARRVLGFRKWLVISAVGQGRTTAQPDTLYDYLPYAIALDCTQEWADLTASLAAEDQRGEGPLWYGGRGTFSPGSLASLSRSAYYFSYPHIIAVAAGSGSASGSSGFSGGYSGGGGGGGGGSW